MQQLSQFQLARDGRRRIAARPGASGLATIHRIAQEALFLIDSISPCLVEGSAALTLALRQRVHFGFDGHRYRPADVRWTNGSRLGLEVREPVGFPCEDGSDEPSRARAGIVIPAKLVVTFPALFARLRYGAQGGILLENPGRLAEGDPLLVTEAGLPAVRGRVRAAADGLIEIGIDRDIDVNL